MSSVRLDESVNAVRVCHFDLTCHVHVFSTKVIFGRLCRGWVHRCLRAGVACAPPSPHQAPARPYVLHDLVYSLLTADFFLLHGQARLLQEPKNQRNLHSPKSSDLGSDIIIYITFFIVGVTLSTTMTHTPSGIVASQAPSTCSLRVRALTSSFLPCYSPLAPLVLDRALVSIRSQQLPQADRTWKRLRDRRSLCSFGLLHSRPWYGLT